MPSPTITPAGPLSKDGLALPTFLAQTQAFASNQDVTWTVTGGILSGVGLRAATWTLPNRSGAWTIRGSNGTDPATVVVVTVIAILPNFWQLNVPVTAAKDVDVFTPTFGPRQYRGIGGGPMVHAWELANDDDEIEHTQELRAFYDYHHPGKQLDMWDPQFGERRRYQVDSDFGFQHTNTQGTGWKMRIREAFPYVIIGS